MKDTLLEFKEKKSLVELVRIFDDDDHSQDGFIIDVSDKYCLFQQFEVFQNLGYRIFRIEDICSCTSDDVNEFRHMLLEREGIINQVKYEHKMNINSMTDIMKSFQKEYFLFTIECETLESESEEVIYDDIYFCCVGEIENDTVWINYFNSLGEWDDEWDGIKMDAITCIQFDSLYLNSYNNYMREKFEKSQEE